MWTPCGRLSGKRTKENTPENSDLEEEGETHVDENKMDQTEELFSDPDKSADDGIESERVAGSSITNQSIEFGATTPTSIKRSNPFRVSVCVCQLDPLTLPHSVSLLR